MDINNYPNLSRIFSEYFLLKRIIKKQERHCKIYPNDILIVRKLYGDFPGDQSENDVVYRYVSFVNFLINKLIWTLNKDGNTNLFNAIYSFGEDSHNRIYFNKVNSILFSIEHELEKSLKENFDFENDIVKQSNYSIEIFCKEIWNHGVMTYLFDRNRLINTKLFKTYITDQYRLSYDLDTIDIKLNGNFYDKYIYSDVNTLFEKIQFLHGQD